MQPTWKDPLATPEGELLILVKSIEKNLGCAETSDFKPNRGDEKLPKLPKSKKQKHNKPKKDMEKATGKNCTIAKPCGQTNCSYCYSGGMFGDGLLNDCADCNSTKTKKGKCACIDKTTEFLETKGIFAKYEQEGSIDNSVPTFQDHSGGTPIQAVNYSTNQVVPDYRNEAPKRSFISEKAQIPSVSQTGYDEKGSSLHMHLNDGGNRSLGNWNKAPIEESLTQLKKAGGYGNPGIVDEIADLIEKVAKRLQ